MALTNNECFTFLEVEGLFALSDQLSFHLFPFTEDLLPGLVPLFTLLHRPLQKERT